MNLKKAILLNMFSKYGTMIIQFVVQMVLARLISPSEFGIISVVLVFLNFFNMLADMGIGASIIQYENMNKKDLQKLFSFCFLIGIILSVAFSAISVPISIVYRNFNYIKYFILISCVAFFNSINTVPNAILTRDKKFDILMKRSIVSSLFTGGVGVCFAFCGFGIYALLIQYIANSIFIFIWNYVENPFRLCKFNFDDVKRLMGSYSTFQLLFNIINYFSRNADNLIIGYTMGDTALGYYNKAYSLNLYPNTLFTSVVTGVLHPYLREYKNNYNELYKKLIYLLKILSIFGVYIMVICFWCSEEIIVIIFGNNWKPAISCFKMLSICILAQMLSSVSGSIFLGIERTDQVFKTGIINLFLIVFSVVLGVLSNNLGILSLMVAISYNIMFWITYFILIKKSMGISFLGFFKSMVGNFAFGFIAIALVFNFQKVYFSNWLSLLIKFLVITCVYLLYLCITGKIRILKGFLKERR